jgi:hypothetical protein
VRQSPADGFLFSVFLASKLGPEYIALGGGLQDMDPDSKEGKEIDSTLDALDKLCAK